MSLRENRVARQAAGALGQDLHGLIRGLYPICRSITGNGVRETLRSIRRLLPMEVHEVPSGTQVFDWNVPREWNIRDGWIKTVDGQRVVDFRTSNLHVMSYSMAVAARVPLAELRQHLHTLPAHPTWIPYKTSYYEEAWGFCVSFEQFQSLNAPEYDVCIDSTLEDGHLTYGECHLPGTSGEECLISCHVCHPSLCNDNLSGIAVAVFLGRWLASLPARRLSYRLLFIPGTIGAITWLSLNQARLRAIRHGMVLTGVGGPGRLVYKRSRRGDAPIDRAAAHVLRHLEAPGEVRDFTPYGYDERQYCSPGINLSVGRLSRTPYQEYPEYHTSADDLDFVTGEQLEGAYRTCQSIVTVLERDRAFVNTSPMGEPQLGRRGLFAPAPGGAAPGVQNLAMLWVLNQSDGAHTLLDIAERAKLPFAFVLDAANRLLEHGLLRPADGPGVEKRHGRS
jgi:aminopeptidase-like protein